MGELTLLEITEEALALGQHILTFGMSSLGRILAVSHTYRPGAIRIISARRVTRAERKIYEEG